jgi:hypothetical protein
VVTIYTNCFNIQQLCVVSTEWIYWFIVTFRMTATISVSVNSVTRLNVVMETCCVLFEAGTECLLSTRQLHKDQVSNTLQRSLQSLDATNINDTCRITKSLTNTSFQITHLKHNSKTAITTQENVNMFADTLEETFQTNPDADTNITVSTEQAVTAFLQQPPQASVTRTNHLVIECIIRHLTTQGPWPGWNSEHSTPTPTAGGLQIYRQNL